MNGKGWTRDVRLVVASLDTQTLLIFDGVHEIAVTLPLCPGGGAFTVSILMLVSHRSLVDQKCYSEQHGVPHVPCVSRMEKRRPCRSVLHQLDDRCSAMKKCR